MSTYITGMAPTQETQPTRLLTLKVRWSRVLLLTPADEEILDADAVGDDCSLDGADLEEDVDSLRQQKGEGCQVKKLHQHLAHHTHHLHHR